MKRAISLLLAAALCLSLCACKSKETKNAEALIAALGEITLQSKDLIEAAEAAYAALPEEDRQDVENHALLLDARTQYDALYHQSLVDAFLAKVTGEWFHVPGGDVYRLNPDGTGEHNGAECSFTIDLENSAITVAEGSSSLRLTYSTESGMARLAAEDAASYYVGPADYEQISLALREEVTAMLLGNEWWKSTADTNYITFTESGGGWFLMPGATMALTWEFVDNNTIQLLIDRDGGQLLALDVVGSGSSAQLTDTETGDAVYVPKK